MAFGKLPIRVVVIEALKIYEKLLHSYLTEYHSINQGC